MARNHLLLFIFVLLVSLMGCASTAPGTKPASPSSAIQQYDQNSWQQMIPTSCQAYFDGCNTCRRNPENGLAACTRKACAAYAKPYCLDDKAAPQRLAENLWHRPSNTPVMVARVLP